MELRRRTSARLEKKICDELHLEDIKEEREEAEASPVKLIRGEPLVLEPYGETDIIGLGRSSSSNNVSSGTNQMTNTNRSPMTNKSLKSDQSWK
jgi:hypothetical protein